MGSGSATSRLLLLDSVDGGVTLAFGLSWFALVGSHASSMARARARRLRATHFVVGGQGAMAGGCARLPPRYRRRKVQAAAQAYAQRHPAGTVACVARLPAGPWWLAAAQDGAVLASADKLYATVEQAELALQALAAQHPALQVHDGARTLQGLLASDNATALLHPVGTWWSRLPLAVRVFLGLLLASAIGPLARPFFTAPLRVADPVAPVDAATAWRVATDHFRQQHIVHPMPELRRVLASLHRLPLNIRGWLLRSARCMPVTHAWSCTAAYMRAEPDATNLAFAQSLPPLWKPRFDLLDGAEIIWTVPGNRIQLHQVPLPSSSEIEQQLASTLQQVMPAFSQLTLGRPAAVPIVAPRDAAGHAIAPPAGLEALRQRALSVQGPLRSIAALSEPGALAISWSSVQLRLAEGRQPNTSVSALTAELQGTLYEKDVHH